MTQHQLPPEYRRTLREVLEPLALSLYQASRHSDTPLVVGIHGAQGTGKSTLTDFLRVLLAYRYRCPTASLSLDDIYCTREQRMLLAKEVHPLLITRGVPGTHDLALGNQVIDTLTRANAGSRKAMPTFNKALDDREPEEHWPLFIGHPEIILLEGWCLGALPESDQALARPLNALEEHEDRDGRWRTHVNDQLRGPYKAFFDRLDLLVMLKAPSMEAVKRWRTEQERKLAERYQREPKVGEDAGRPAPEVRIMGDQELDRFVMHYERVTRHCLAEMPERADVLLELDEEHNLTGD
jgi:D-glycerate 3-kinase